MASPNYGPAPVDSGIVASVAQSSKEGFADPEIRDHEHAKRFRSETLIHSAGVMGLKERKKESDAPSPAASPQEL